MKNMPMQTQGSRPTVAIITSKYYEKLSVDAMMEDKTTFVRYKTEGVCFFMDFGFLGFLWRFWYFFMAFLRFFCFFMRVFGVFLWGFLGSFYGVFGVFYGVFEVYGFFIGFCFGVFFLISLFKTSFYIPPANSSIHHPLAYLPS